MRGCYPRKNLDNCKNGNILFCQPVSQPDHNFTSLMSLSRKRKWRAAILLSKMPNKNIFTQFSLSCSWSTYSTRKRHTTLYTKITILTVQYTLFFYDFVFKKWKFHIALQFYFFATKLYLSCNKMICSTLPKYTYFQKNRCQRAPSPFFNQDQTKWEFDESRKTLF